MKPYSNYYLPPHIHIVYQTIGAEQGTHREESLQGIERASDLQTS